MHQLISPHRIIDAALCMSTLIISLTRSALARGSSPYTSLCRERYEEPKNMSHLGELRRYCSEKGYWGGSECNPKGKKRGRGKGWCSYHRWISNSQCDSRPLKTRLPRMRVLFAGDSTLWRLHDAARRLKSDTCLRSRSGTRCTLMEWYGIERGNFTPPLSNQGPFNFTTGTEFCTDCTRCYPNSITCQGGASFDFVPLEFTLDVEHPSPTSHTSQGTLAKYLSTNPPDFLVIGAGFHDMLLGISSREYAERASKLLSLVAAHVKREIVWISMNHVRGDKGHVQHNLKVNVWNEAVIEMLSKRLADDLTLHVSYFDQFMMSQPSFAKHIDNIHMDRSFYALLFVILMNKILCSRAPFAPQTNFTQSHGARFFLGSNSSGKSR